MPAIDLNEGLITVDLGTDAEPKPVVLDPYWAHDEFERLKAKYDKECESVGELPTLSEFYPRWAERVTKVSGFSAKAAQSLHRLVVEAMDDEKKAEPASPTPG